MLLALLLFAADPVIDVAKESKVYVPVVVKLKGASTSTQVKWKLIPAPAWQEKLDAKEGVGFRFTGAPGTYKFTALYVDFKAELFGELEGETAIVGEGPKPDPGPGPNPNPNPPGPVVASKIWIVVVEESGEAAANRGAIFGDPTLNAYMASKGHSWRIVDKDVKSANGQPPADVKRFLDKAAGKPYPSVFFVDEKGRVRGEATIQPGDTASNVLGILKTYDGSQ